MSTPGRVRGLLAAVVFATVGSALAGCATSAGAAAPAATPTAVSTSPAGPTPTPRSAARGPQPLPARKPVQVTSVAIAAIGVRATHLEKLPLESDGSLASPENPDRAGWYADGTVPGETGPAVIAGHVDSKTGPAVFFDLREVERGDVVRVGLSNGRTKQFVVDRVVTVPKKGFPTDEVFGPTPDAELRLITCGGAYDRTAGGYLANTLVFASLR